MILFTLGGPTTASLNEPFPSGKTCPARDVGVVGWVFL